MEFLKEKVKKKKKGGSRAMVQKTVIAVAVVLSVFISSVVSLRNNLYRELRNSKFDNYSLIFYVMNFLNFLAR